MVLEYQKGRQLSTHKIDKKMFSLRSFMFAERRAMPAALRFTVISNFHVQ
jgi:hypothetical protein